MDKKTNLLITGGAGFIGSNLVECFLQDNRVGQVSVLENLSKGYIENIQETRMPRSFQFLPKRFKMMATSLSIGTVKLRETLRS